MAVPTQITSKNTKETASKEPKVKAPVMQDALAPESNLSMADMQRAVADPRTARPSDVLALQHKYGNKAVQHLLENHNIQARLTVGAANDAYEQEADRVAAQVMSMPEAAPKVQRMGEEEEEQIQAKPLATTITPLVQRAAAPEEEEELQAKSINASDSFEPGADFENRLAATRGDGRPLPESTREFMEQRFGADFSNVRLHIGGESAKINHEISAQAFTRGQDVYLGDGKENLESSTGKHLLAHELTHVVQQTYPLQALNTLQRQGYQDFLNWDPTLEHAQVSADQAHLTAVPAPLGVAQVGQPEPVVAAPVATPAIAPEPALATIIQECADEHGYNLRELELRLQDPLTTLYSYLDEDARLICSNVYRGLIGEGRTKLTGSCGQTSNLLKDSTFSGESSIFNGSKALFREIRNAVDTFLRVQVGCHSFILEKKDDTVRVYQSYFGFAALADNIPLDQPIATETFISKLRKVIHADPDRGEHLTPEELELFHGEVNATANAPAGKRYKITVEVPTKRKSTDEIKKSINETLARYQRRWDEFETSRESIETLRSRWEEEDLGMRERRRAPRGG